MISGKGDAHMKQQAPVTYTLETGEKIVLRSGFPDDGAKLAALRNDIAAEGTFLFPGIDDAGLDETRARTFIQACRERPGWVCLVAERSEHIVGVIEFTNGSTPETAHQGTLTMTVRKGWRHMGIGTILLQGFFDWVATVPLIKKVKLSVVSTNPKAYRLFKSFDFEVEGKCPREVRLPSGKYADTILMYRFVR